MDFFIFVVRPGGAITDARAIGKTYSDKDTPDIQVGYRISHWLQEREHEYKKSKSCMVSWCPRSNIKFLKDCRAKGIRFLRKEASGWKELGDDAV